MSRSIAIICALLVLAGCASPRKPAQFDLPKVQSSEDSAASAPAPALVVPPPVPPPPPPAPVIIAPAPEPVFYDEPLTQPLECAAPSDRGETDGGYGGTGVTPPQDCPPAI